MEPIYLVSKRLSNCAVHYQDLTIRADCATLSKTCKYFETIFENEPTPCNRDLCDSPFCIELDDKFCTGQIKPDDLKLFLIKLYECLYEPEIPYYLSFIQVGQTLCYDGKYSQVIKLSDKSISIIVFADNATLELPSTCGQLSPYEKDTFACWWSKSIYDVVQAKLPGTDVYCDVVVTRRYDTQLTVDSHNTRYEVDWRDIKPKDYIHRDNEDIINRNVTMLELANYFDSKSMFLWVEHAFTDYILDLILMNEYDIIWQLLSIADKYHLENSRNICIPIALTEPGIKEESLFTKRTKTLSKDCIGRMLRLTLS